MRLSASMRYALRAGALGCACYVLLAEPAWSQSIGDIFVNALKSAVVTGAWAKVDQPTKDCLANQYNTPQDSLIQQGILPTDPRIAPQIQACQQGAQAQQQQQTEQQREQAALAAQQASPQLQAARKKELTAKYGRKMADVIVAGQIKLGMTKDEVTEAWGSPSAVDNNTPGKEKWSYGSDIAVFTGGKLTGVEH